MTLHKTQMPRFVYVGKGGPLSVIPIKTLAEAGIFPEAILIPERSQSSVRLNLLPVQPPRYEDDLATIAADMGLPLISWQRGFEAEIEAKLANIGINLAIMSCFPWRIPAALLAVPEHGWWNLHPSLLPAYRGPSPLYWQIQAGETMTGISLHQVETDLDTGPIISQASCQLTDAAGLEQKLAQLGANLITEALHQLQEGNLVTTIQDENRASYQSFPGQLEKDR